MHGQALQKGSQTCRGNPDALISHKRHISNRLESTKLGIKDAEYKLSKLIDFENFHTSLNPEQTLKLELFAGIPKCLKIDLR